MKCICRREKKKPNYYSITWTSSNMNRFEWRYNTLFPHHRPWKFIILNNSPFYFIYDISLEELVSRIDTEHKKYLNTLYLKKNNSRNIIVSCSIHNEDDIMDKLKYGTILKITWKNDIIEYAYYANN
jgi:hypothetical protein